jgi:hypothetical protein
MSVGRLRTRLGRRCVAAIRGAIVLSLLVPVISSAGVSSASAALCPPSATPPSPAAPQPPPPDQVVACIGAQPITGAAFSHWAAIAAKAEEPPGKRPPPSAAAVKQEVMGFLISSNWVLGEARDLGVHVTEAEVRHSFDHIRNQVFHTRREFHAFLRASGETLGDLVFRMRLNLTSVRIQRHIIAGHHGTRSKERALETFVVNFKRKWQAQTSCASQFAVADCGRVY